MTEALYWRAHKHAYPQVFERQSCRVTQFLYVMHDFPHQLLAWPGVSLTEEEYAQFWRLHFHGPEEDFDAFLLQVIPDCEATLWRLAMVLRARGLPSDL